VGVVGQQWGDTNDGGIDYAYWNIGLTLAVWDKLALTLRRSLLGYQCEPAAR
jgi:hypothetical protein